MSRLTDEELMEIQNFIDRARRDLDGRGLTVEVDTDLSNWARLLRRVPQAGSVVSTHDPRRSYVHPGNAFWLIVRENKRRWWRHPLERDGRIIACLCHKVVETEDILDDVRTHKLFFDKKPILDYRPLDIVASPNMPVITGKVGLAGGFWVHPRHRGTMLSDIVSRMTRVLSLRHFDIDWAVSLVKDTPGRKAMIHGAYGIPNSISIMRGYYPPYGRDLDIQMSYMHRDEMIRQVIAENSAETPSPAFRVEPAAVAAAETRSARPRIVASKRSVH
jgi:hypothetical protein